MIPLFSGLPSASVGEWELNPCRVTRPAVGSERPVNNSFRAADRLSRIQSTIPRSPFVDRVMFVSGLATRTKPLAPSEAWPS
jgi:hypothetical protein